MFEKLIRNAYARQVKKQQGNVAEAKMTKDEKEKAVTYEHLRNLYQFVRWLEKHGFDNRKSRKGFWKSVQSNTELVPETIDTISKRYARRPKEEKVEEKNKTKKIKK